MDRRALATLADLADRALKGDLARLAVLRAARAGLLAEVARLEEKAAAEAELGADPATLAAYAGWRDWARRRRRRIEAEDRAVREKMEAVRKRAAAHLGRCEAVGILDQRAALREVEIRAPKGRAGRPAGGPLAAPETRPLAPSGE